MIPDVDEEMRIHSIYICGKKYIPQIVKTAFLS